jgi:hypothetical protein
MPRRKRSEKVEVAVRPAPVRPQVAAERIVAAICPCCGRTIPEKRAIKAGYVTVDHIGYFASIEWDEKKAFGVSYLPGGRGSMGWSYIDPEEAPELFEAVKARLIRAVREWINKAWLSEEEISIALKSPEA